MCMCLGGFGNCCRCLRSPRGVDDPAFKFSAWVRMPATQTGFQFGRNGGMPRNESLETASYFVWSQSFDAITFGGPGNPPYYLLGVLRLGKGSSRRPRFLVLIHDSAAPTITDASDLNSMPTGKEGALYECGPNGWTLVDFNEYTGAYAAGSAPNYILAVKLEGSNVDAVGQDASENANDGSDSDRTLLPAGVVCKSPLPMFSPSDPPSTIQIQFSGWPGETAYLNGTTHTMIPRTAPFPGTYYDICEYWLGNPAGGYVVDQTAVGLPGHEIWPLGTNSWTWSLRYLKPVAANLVPLVEVALLWSQCDFAVENQQPMGTWYFGGDGTFGVREGWYFWSQFEHPDDANGKAHWVGKTTEMDTAVLSHIPPYPVFQTRYRRGLEFTQPMGTIAFVQ